MNLAYFHGCFRFLHPSKTPTKESAEFSDSHIWPQVAICHWDYSISNIFIVFLNFASILNTFFHLRLLYNYIPLGSFFSKIPPRLKKKTANLTTPRTTHNPQPTQRLQHQRLRFKPKRRNGFRLVFCTQMGILHQLDPTSTQLLGVAGIEIDPPQMGRFLQVDGRADGWNPIVFPMFDLYMYIIPILIKMVLKKNGSI